jgi:hypothetical protein
MTDEQLQDEKRLTRYIECHQLVSAMNDTKWRETIACLESIPGYRVDEFRVRCVRDPAGAVGSLDRSFPHHIPTYRSIEWLDVAPVVRRQSGAVDRGKGQDFTAAILAALTPISVPISLEDGYIRIWGYYRPGRSPAIL